MRSVRRIAGCFMCMMLSLTLINYVPAGEKFTIQDIQFNKASRQHAKVRGKITNNSGKTLPHADFIISAYDKDGKLINTTTFNIRNFKKGSTKTFSTSIEADARKIAGHKIELVQKEVKLIGSAKGFTPQNMDFIKSSRTFTKIQGGLLNESGKDLRQADFIIHVYDDDGNLKNSAHFSLRNFIKGTTREFNATVQANIKDIGRYKIELKELWEIPPLPSEY